MSDIVTKILNELQALGTEQNRKIYKRHGAREPLFGVSFANLNKLKKRIKTNHELALSLWDTNNLDAMTLATMIADPAAATNEMLDKWAKDLYCYALTDLFSTYVSQTIFAKNKMELWVKSNDEWLTRTGWNLLSRFAMQKDKSLSDEIFENYLNIIQKNIHVEKNTTKHAMNNALIAIGLHNKVLEKLALKVAKEIGKVKIDYGETNCKTPDATSYILKVKTRRGLC